MKVHGQNVGSGTDNMPTAWAQTGTKAKKAFSVDPSLNDPTQRELSQLGFSQSDFSDSLTVWPLSGGTTTQQATLDLCSPEYASDKLRTDRRQVFVSQSPEKFVFLSTETVRYQSAAAVQQALKELDEHVDKCRADGYAMTSAGEKQVHEFLPLPALPTGLVSEQDRRIYLVNIGESGTATTLLAAYQFSGNTLNALYVVVEGANNIDAAMASGWLSVGAVLAQRLQEPSPKTIS